MTNYTERSSAVVDSLWLIYRLDGLDAARNTEVPEPLEGVKENVIETLEDGIQETWARQLLDDGVIESERQFLELDWEEARRLVSESGYDPEINAPQPASEVIKHTVEKLMGAPQPSTESPDSEMPSLDASNRDEELENGQVETESGMPDLSAGDH